MRQGLPVNERDRTVSRLEASSSDCFWAGGRSASSTVSQSVPLHTPAQPRASAAAICSPVPMPPAASTGVGATAVDDLGPEHDRADLAGVAAALAALGDDDVDAGFLVLQGLVRRAAERGDRAGPRPGPR